MSERMDWQEKFAAIRALSEYQTCLRMRLPGNWYVDSPVDVSNGVTLVGRYGNGATPEEAVEDHWQQWTSLASGEALAVPESGSAPRRYVRWNGFMWADVARPEPRT